VSFAGADNVPDGLYHRQQYRGRLTAGLHALGSPRLDRE
jgi:hypothetical protein